MSTFVYWNWEEVDVNWEALDLNWEEVGFLIDVVLPSGGGGAWAPSDKKVSNWYDLKRLNDLDEDQKRKIIRRT